MIWFRDANLAICLRRVQSRGECDFAKITNDPPQGVAHPRLRLHHLFQHEGFWWLMIMEPRRRTFGRNRSAAPNCPYSGLLAALASFILFVCLIAIFPV